MQALKKSLTRSAILASIWNNFLSESINPVKNSLTGTYFISKSDVVKLCHHKVIPNALSFYWSKMILDHPNNFGRVPIVLERSHLFWWGPNHFGQVQIIKINTEKSNLNMTKMIWTRPKRFGPDQNNLDCPKLFWTYRRTRHKLYGGNLRWIFQSWKNI